MSFTAKLGTPESMPGNITFGLMFGSLTQTINETLTLTDTLTGVRFQLADSITLTDTIVGLHTALGVMSDSLTLIDSIHSVQSGNGSDTLVLTDSFTGAVWKLGNWTDTLSLTESLLNEFVGVRTLTEALTLIDTLQRTLVRLRSFSETITFTEALNGIAVKAFGDSMTFTGVLSAFVAKVFRDVLDFGDTLVATNRFNRSTADQVVFFDSLGYTAVLRESLIEMLTFSDSILGIRVKPLVPETVVFNDTLAGQRSLPLQTDHVTFTEAASFSKVQHHTLNETVLFVDAIQCNHILAKQIDDVVEFLDQLKGIRARFGTFSDTLTFADRMYREVHSTLTSDTVSFVENLSYVKDSERTFNETISLTDQLDLTKISVRGWSDYLLFSEGFSVKIKKVTGGQEIVNGVGYVASPGYSPLAPGAPPITDDLAGYIPSAVWQGVTAVLPQVVLTGLTRAIVLPPPEFNDFVAGQGKIAIQRSMMGSFRVYAKRTNREKLNWRFIIPKYKADEFEQFLLAEINNEITLIDFDGNYWKVRVLSDSVDFTETGRWAPCGNKVEVTLELVGYRYA
jgi:hypothetical protein